MRLTLFIIITCSILSISTFIYLIKDFRASIFEMSSMSSPKRAKFRKVGILTPLIRMTLPKWMNVTSKSLSHSKNFEYLLFADSKNPLPPLWNSTNFKIHYIPDFETYLYKRIFEECNLTSHDSLIEGMKDFIARDLHRSTSSHSKKKLDDVFS